jgi:hypothetical protein
LRIVHEAFLRPEKAKLHEIQLRDDLQVKSSDELIGMMWQLALNAWSFKETVDVEPRLQRHVVVIKRGRG